MYAIILVAGKGSRISPRVLDQPKCLLTFRGQTILFRAVQHLVHFGCTTFILVAGYKHERIQQYVEQVLQNVFPKVIFRITINSQYDSTNTAKSLECALLDLKKWMQPTNKTPPESLLVCDGDVLFLPTLLPRFLAFPKRIQLACSQRDAGSVGIDEAMKIEARSNGTIRAVGKQLTPDRTWGEFIGIAWYPYSFLSKWLIALSTVHQHSYYEEALQRLIDQGATAFLYPIHPNQAIEIDTEEDLRLAYSTLTFY